MGHQLIHLQPCLWGVLIAHIKCLIACGRVMQRLDTHISDVCTTDALRDAVTLHSKAPPGKDMVPILPLTTAMLQYLIRAVAINRQGRKSRQQTNYKEHPCHNMRCLGTSYRTPVTLCGLQHLQQTTKSVCTCSSPVAKHAMQGAHLR